MLAETYAMSIKVNPQKVCYRPEHLKLILPKLCPLNVNPTPVSTTLVRAKDTSVTARAEQREMRRMPSPAATRSLGFPQRLANELAAIEV